MEQRVQPSGSAMGDKFRSLGFVAVYEFSKNIILNVGRG